MNEELTPRWELADAATAGVYRIERAEVEAIEKACHAAGLYCAHLDLEPVKGKAELLDGLARAFKFPTWFGHNWDALADCLDDLGWLPRRGYLLVLDNPLGFNAAAPKDYELTLDILAHAARKWSERKKPFWVFIVGGKARPDPRA